LAQLVATLLDAEGYPLADVADLYRRRWEIETNFAHLTTTMGMDVLHCRGVEGVLKELTMFALINNLAGLAMLAAAREHSTPLTQTARAKATARGVPAHEITATTAATTVDETKRYDVS
jgi:hypothetical protein